MKSDLVGLEIEVFFLAFSMVRYFVKAPWCEIYREGFYIHSIPDGTGKFQKVFFRVLLLENSRMFYLRARPVK